MMPRVHGSASIRRASEAGREKVVVETASTSATYTPSNLAQVATTGPYATNSAYRNCP
jgi:hypothetical protein